ncbi:unnamed protein product [Amoebophrya sp. A25]|nr:unnamed protein product [Amoebophrya sp. A25]|eukprot:GSA25T00023539001.1
MFAEESDLQDAEETPQPIQAQQLLCEEEMRNSCKQEMQDDDETKIDDTSAADHPVDALAVEILKYIFVPRPTQRIFYDVWSQGPRLLPNDLAMKIEHLESLPSVLKLIDLLVSTDEKDVAHPVQELEVLDQSLSPSQTSKELESSSETRDLDAQARDRDVPAAISRRTRRHWLARRSSSKDSFSRANGEETRQDEERADGVSVGDSSRTSYKELVDITAQDVSVVDAIRKSLSYSLSLSTLNSMYKKNCVSSKTKKAVDQEDRAHQLLAKIRSNTEQRLISQTRTVPEARAASRALHAVFVKASHFPHGSELAFAKLVERGTKCPNKGALFNFLWNTRFGSHFRQWAYEMWIPPPVKEVPDFRKAVEGTQSASEQKSYHYPRAERAWQRQEGGKQIEVVDEAHIEFHPPGKGQFTI